jgi:hypothetical protein
VDILGRIPYKGDLWLPSGVKSQDIIYEILNNVASMPYELDPDLYDIMVMGWIPAGTCRDALQQIAFAIGAYVDCSRSNLIKIYKTKIMENATSGTAITAADIGIKPALELRPLVTGVEVSGHNYTVGTETVKLFNGTLAVGRYTIIFKQPVHTLTITGAAIVSSNANYATVNVTTAGTIVITGLNYDDSQQLYGIYNSVPTSTVPNILSITDATLVNADNIVTVATLVNDYYQQRYLLKGRLYQPAFEIGQVALVDSFYNSQIKGCLEKMELDLSGGYIADVEIAGVVA